ncbi:MAG: TIGR03986 family CRISPR-associated RAMP protein [Stenomitos frigidus ULC029]
MSPKHLKEVSVDRIAVAPYNFVELPEQVVPAQPIPPANIYNSKHHTGWIDCQLETSSPLYIRCGLTSEQFLASKEAKDLPEFFTHPGNLRPTLPGSSLRGLLRSLIEIISFGKLDESRVDSKSSFTFRAVAAKGDDPLGDTYKRKVNAKTVRAGYLLCEGDQWYIQPAIKIDQKPFVWIRDDKIELTGFISVDDASYYPQYFTNVSFGRITIKNTRPFTEQISGNPDQLQYKKGVLITSGNMAETGSGAGTSPRKNHCLVGQRDVKAPRLSISPEAVRIYRDTLTEFQQNEHAFSSTWGVLQSDRCIFYCQPEPGQAITLFGHSPNFRIPYLHKETDRPITIADLIPENLRNSQLVDLADAIFGYVRPGKATREQAQAGRVFVSDATCDQTVEADIWLSSTAIMPHILSGPKLTTFQHYLTQGKSSKRDLNHYASQPGTKTVIRGHKLYWHKGALPQIEHPDPVNAPETQMTTIRPIKPGVKFTFKIQFENLRDEELGALLWLLNVAQDETYRLSLGMGKPLGMGAIKIESTLHLSDRSNRYSKLFSQAGWEKAETASTDHINDRCITAFEEYILNNIGELDHPSTEKAKSLTELPRIQMLLAMLQWGDAPSSDKTRYMTIEPNEYRERPVLPTPFQVLGDLNRDTRDLSIAAKPQVAVEKPVLAQRTEVAKQPEPSSPKVLSERKAEIQLAIATAQTAVGDKVAAIVRGKKGHQITYEITATTQRLTQREPKKAATLTENHDVEVEIMELYEDGRIKRIKLV